ncbi:MAG: FeoB small GTPase domain-containing protein [Elusimicrobia bacterium]|nr:FeoB small GTPase domain-containing protein [Elusimicrobiota bacterium]
MAQPFTTIKKLSELKKNGYGTVAAIAHSDKKVKNRLNAMGLHKGCEVKRKNSSFPILIDADGVEIAVGKEFAEHILIETTQKVIFLMGNPNVGKSTVFSRLTGVKTDASNYPGTTVSLLNGETVINKHFYTVYDMPGIYSLQEESRTDEESCMLIKNTPYDVAIYVLDSQHLERNLYFALDIIALGKPTVLLLNKFDIAKKKGIEVDTQKLSDFLGVPVIASNGTNGMGFKELSSAIDNLATGKMHYHPVQIPSDQDEKWKLIGKISAQAQKITHRHPSLIEKLEEAASSGWFGLPLAFLVMMVSFFIIHFVGENCIDLLTPVYENYYLPLMQHIFSFTEGTFIYTILFGSASEVTGGLGILSEGVKIAFVDVLPYVISFYAVLDFLSMLGYLPRLAILLDSLLHKIGLHGYSAIPIMLGFGCKVPAIMAVRSLETKRQKIIALVLILMMVPCISQTAMMFSVVAPYGIGYLLGIFAIMLTTGLLAGLALNKILPGDTSDIFMEVPGWQWPKFVPFIKQLGRRAKDFIVEAIPLIIAGMFIITIADMTGLINLIENAMQGLVTYVLGLPKETASVILLGFLRKDVSIALLTPFALTGKQMLIACVFMAMYMPCTASFFVLLREGGLKDGLKIIFLTLILSVLIGGLLNFIL